MVNNSLTAVYVIRGLSDWDYLQFIHDQLVLVLLDLLVQSLIEIAVKARTHTRTHTHTHTHTQTHTQRTTYGHDLIGMKSRVHIFDYDTVF